MQPTRPSGFLKIPPFSIFLETLFDAIFGTFLDSFLEPKAFQNGGQKVLKIHSKIECEHQLIFDAFGSQTAPKMESKSILFGILFGKRENVKIAASCRRERQNEGLEGSERQQKTDPKQ